MFTGIIEELGMVKDIAKEKGNLLITVESPFAAKLRLNESVAHNGACLSIIPFTKKAYKVMAVQETLSKTNLGQLKKGDCLNLERSLLANGRIDGHFVLGHVDATVTCLSIKKLEGSNIYTFTLSKSDRKYIVPKGSITLNGVSLTIAKVDANCFSVVIIPYTYGHTNFKNLKVGDKVNVEYDVLGKYVLGSLSRK